MRRYRIALSTSALCLALGCMLISLRWLVLYSGFYDATLFTAPSSLQDWLIEFATLCAYIAGLLLAYRLLSADRTNRPLRVTVGLALFLGLGGLIGIMGVMAGGWRLGICNFLIGGAVSIALGSGLTLMTRHMGRSTPPTIR